MAQVDGTKVVALTRGDPQKYRREREPSLYIEGGADSAEVSRGRSSWKTRKGIAGKDRKDTCRAVHLTTVMRALSNRKLEEWGCPSASRYFESVHPKYSAVQLQLVF